jgi:hypothetical protein
MEGFGEFRYVECHCSFALYPLLHKPHYKLHKHRTCHQPE